MIGERLQDKIIAVLASSTVSMTTVEVRHHCGLSKTKQNEARLCADLDHLEELGRILKSEHNGAVKWCVAPWERVSWQLAMIYNLISTRIPLRTAND